MLKLYVGLLHYFQWTVILNILYYVVGPPTWIALRVSGRRLLAPRVRRHGTFWAPRRRHIESLADFRGDA
jgi:hypothetical protein